MYLCIDTIEGILGDLGKAGPGLIQNLKKLEPDLYQTGITSTILLKELLAELIKEQFDTVAFSCM